MCVCVFVCVFVCVCVLLFVCVCVCVFAVACIVAVSLPVCLPPVFLSVCVRTRKPGIDAFRIVSCATALLRGGYDRNNSETFGGGDAGWSFEEAVFLQIQGYFFGSGVACILGFRRQAVHDNQALNGGQGLDVKDM